MLPPADQAVARTMTMLAKPMKVTISPTVITPC
jgi:hypothetical protein